MRTFPGVVPSLESGAQDEEREGPRGKEERERTKGVSEIGRERRWSGGRWRGRVRKGREREREKAAEGYGTRKWREGQLEGGKIYLRTTGVRGW